MNEVKNLPKQDATLAILGGGFLGGFVAAKAKQRYETIYACVAQDKPRPNLSQHGVQIRAGDIFESRAKFLPATERDVFDLIFMIPPSAIPDHEQTFSELVSSLADSACRRALLISSTGVYAVPDGAVVSAETPSDAKSGRAAKLLRIENQWLSGGKNFGVLRLAGIYGPGRVVGAKALSEGTSLGGSPDAWLNLIHAADAAELSLRCLDGSARPIELGADGHPVKRGEYYQFVANLIHASPADFAGTTKRNTNSKRCDPSSTFERLDFVPMFPNYTDGVRACLDASAK